MADLMENYFAGMNVPSRGQLTALNERLTSIEGELAETRALLKQVLAAPAAPAPVVDPTATLNDIKGMLEALVAASKAPPVAPTPVDPTLELNEIKTLLGGLVAASKVPQPAPDVSPALSEIKALLAQLLEAAQAPAPAPAVASEPGLQPVEPEPSAVEAPPRAAEPVRQGKRNKRHGGMPAASPRPGEGPSGG
ncbi:hypothetical protein [Bradyrhizobium sp. STM 3809]|uniref:hypothetical protein n=1 Tax=Bradyrhizobium sp. STM 3809 TaxID=551936 RepID=UPI001F0B3C15|nr:hypothetical protein [Bradyrhizobium sp. STM 3809]